MTGLRVGVLGCGDIVWRRMAPTLVAAPGIDVVATGSRDPGKARRFADRFGCEPETYEGVLKRSDVDAVYVALPPALHAAWTERALAAGKHALVEKPLTRTRAEAAALFARAAESGLVVMENFMALHHSQHGAVAAMVADGAIGEVRGFAAAFTMPPRPRDDFRYRQAMGDGALEFGVYPLRTALHHLGPDLALVGAVLRRDGTVQAGDVLLCDARGVPAHLRFGMDHAYRTFYELTGSTGRLTLDRAFTPPPSHRPVVRIERQDRVEEITLPGDDHFANIVAAFADAVRGRADLTEWTRMSLAQAALVDEILARARIVDL
ncbi:Gfo/Idh/MocA family protein [Actinomadura sp. WAC 06369]|uniref:Gfo/Idh/MocA family protein n=1 Tax=Actinomadura sp. WAC 06369 TaxID=2203193 RepID=UPI000F7780F7|nr:Gfo/Idh/MocA family oxidoreductase [Actinomadura sp. WAC 06369]RSN72156.1 oxidoreductase [Actinomadura sp. WAC 06369]